MDTKNTNQRSLICQDYAVIHQNSDTGNVGKGVEQSAMRIITPNSKEMMEKAEMMISYLESVAKGGEDDMDHNEYIVDPQGVHQFLDELRKLGEDVSSFQERLDAVKLLIFLRDVTLALYYSKIKPGNAKYIPESIQKNIDRLREYIYELRALESECMNAGNIPTLIQNRINQLNKINPDVATFQHRFNIIKPTMLRELTEEALSALEQRPDHPAFSLDTTQSFIDQMRKIENAEAESMHLMIKSFQSRLDILKPRVRIALAEVEIISLENFYQTKISEILQRTKERANALIDEAKSANADTTDLQRRLDAISI